MSTSELMSWERRQPGSQVLVVTNAWPYEDDPYYGIFVRREVDALGRLGVPCDVLFIHGYRTKSVYPRAALRLLRWNLSRSFRYRIVHAHGGETALAARFIVRVPVVATYIGDDLQAEKSSDGSVTKIRRVRAWVQRKHAASFSHTVTMSRTMERLLPAAARKRNLVCPSGVELSTFAPFDQAVSRARLGWPDDELTVVFAANPARPGKRFWLAQAAVEGARERLPQLRLRVAAEVRPEMMSVWMNAAHCLIMTSVSEGSPNVVKEAIACGLPVVTTRVGDVEEMLHEVTPSRVCRDDPAKLADGILECLSHRKRSNGPSFTHRFADDRLATRIAHMYRLLPERHDRSPHPRPTGP